MQELKPGHKLAGTALFRGRLRAFGKCTNGVALSKGRPNLASVQLMHPLGKIVVHTCSDKTALVHKLKPG